MIKKLFVTSALMISLVSFAQSLRVTSPDGLLTVSTDIDNGMPYYTLNYDGSTMIKESPLGFKSNIGDYSHEMTIVGHETGTVEKNYNQDRIKKSHIEYRANSLIVNYENKNGQQMSVEWQVSDNNVAFRYLIPKDKDTGSMIVREEVTGFSFPESTTTFLTPQSEAMIGWKRTKPSYEEHYTYDAPLNTISQFGRGFTFPCLFRVGDDGWALMGETDVDGYYCGSRLSDYIQGKYTIAYPMPEENNGNGSSSPGISLPGHTPWRTLTVGKTLAPIIETTISWDVVEPRYEIERMAQPGKGTWSWIMWQDGSINIEDQKKYIDLASQLGFQNTLIDNWWDTNIGREGVEELIKYAKSKNVNVALWFSSSGHWNDIVQGPINRMDRPIPRKKEMKWMHDNGVHTIKVDFFGGDKQETIRLYEDILSDAADYGIDVIFHGCTLPRGWERMYPNFIGSEAVLASENLIFGQEFCDLEATYAATHPFIRNSLAIMEYGGTMLNRRMNRGNDGGNIRRTGNTFEIATAVLFQNPIQNFALSPNNLNDAPIEAIQFMKAVPTTWDAVKYIDGYPGKNVTLARRNGDSWYIAGVNAEDKPYEVDIDINQFISNKDAKITLYIDKNTSEMEVKDIPYKSWPKQKINVPKDCGFVITIR